jgi:hypothetical protein
MKVLTGSRVRVMPDWPAEGMVPPDARLQFPGDSRNVLDLDI